jgi:hypothetical protein
MTELIAISLRLMPETEHQHKRVRIECALTGFKKHRRLHEGITLQDVAENICRTIHARALGIAVLNDSAIVLLLPMTFHESLKKLK